MRRSLLAVLSLLIASLPVGGAHAEPGIRVGVGITDATWHVGTGSGQYADKNPNALNLATGGEIDPHNHGLTQSRSYGVQSRLSYRAIVVEGTNGNRMAMVKSDSYLAQDFLVRRAAQILANGTSGIGYEDIMLMASHNHSSPYYMSPSWGVWLFQDAFEIRTFEYHARQLALAIERASASLRPARMGATTVTHKIYKGNIAGATITDDGTPGGYPDTHADFGLTVVRFDEVDGTPITVLANFGQHPESLDGYDLITGDFLAPLERMVARDLGAPLVFSQGDVGSAEGPYDRGSSDILDDGVTRSWAHVGHAQTERGARYLADDIKRAWDAIGADEGLVPFSSDFPVFAANAFVPGPVSHPYPSVSNCRSETTVEGNPGAPILGLPDCERGGSTDRNAMVWENLKNEGLPVPDSYDAPAFTGVEENLRLRLQVFRMGEVVFASCACEAQMDLILNFESRANATQGDIFDGYEYPCTQNGDTTWTCLSGSKLQSTVVVSDARHARMVAQVHNDAKGWDLPENAIAANSEPADPSKIWGNFTKEELPADLGYTLPVGVGHATDYNGYTVSYREYMSRDHYRKALTSYGPHTADYMSTRMVRLAGSLKGGPALADEPGAAVALADEARQAAEALALGQASSAAYDAWLAALPDDAGDPAVIAEPSNITRFQAATFKWRGGSNAVDNPTPRVERSVDGAWVPFADQSGEVQTMVKFPEGAQGTAETYAGATEWVWTANFEAFDAFPRAAVPGGQTPDGTYRFVIDGQVRHDGVNQPYHLESQSFEVGRWTGITASDARIEGDGSVSFVADVRYPKSYASDFRYIATDNRANFCMTCSFRPWATTGTLESATVHVLRSGGGVESVPATFAGGRWSAPTALAPGDVATIEPGDLVDSFGETNGASTAF